MSNVIKFPVENKRVTAASWFRSYAALPAFIIRNTILNRKATELQKKGWTLKIHPLFIECAHPAIRCSRPIELADAWEMQQVIDRVLA